MDRFRNFLTRVMQGRYGADQFGRFLLRAAFVLLIVSVFVRNRALSTIISVIVFYQLFRMFSRNYAARSRENEQYLAALRRITSSFRRSTRSVRDRDHAYFNCPSCAQTVRVPRGKGHILIRCPKCGREFEKET